MPKKTGIIYKATNKINGKSYIGQTTQGLRMRRNDHQKQVNKKSKKHPPFVRALIKYGRDAFEWSVIHKDVTIDQLDNMEILAIKNYNTLVENKQGYNIESGGNKNKYLSEETKRKISNSLKGKKHSPERRKKSSEAHKGIDTWNKGKTHKDDERILFGKNHPYFGKSKEMPMYGKNHTEETKRKMSSAAYGKITSEHTKEKISRANKGKTRTEQQKEKLAESRGSVLFGVYKKGKFVGSWINQSQCSRDLGLTVQCVNQCLIGKKLSHKGYTFVKIK